jgi:hypothetical protein
MAKVQTDRRSRLEITAFSVSGWSFLLNLLSGSFEIFAGDHIALFALGVAADNSDDPSSRHHCLRHAIRSADRKDQVMRLSSPVMANGRQDMSAKLVFHRYGSTYYLSQVWAAGTNNGRQLAKTRQERAAESELKKIAAYHGETKPVYAVVQVIASLR